MRDPVSIFDMLLVLASFKAVQNGLLTQQRVNRSNTGHSGFHLWTCSKERVPSYCLRPPSFATAALLPRDHVALNTVRLETEKERWGWNGGSKAGRRYRYFFSWRFGSLGGRLCIRGQNEESFLLYVSAFLSWKLPVFRDIKKRAFIRALRNIHNGDFANMVSDLTAKETLGASPTRNLIRPLINPSLLETVS